MANIAEYYPPLYAVEHIVVDNVFATSTNNGIDPWSPDPDDNFPIFD